MQNRVQIAKERAAICQPNSFNLEEIEEGYKDRDVWSITLAFHET